MNKKTIIGLGVVLVVMVIVYQWIGSMTILPEDLEHGPIENIDGIAYAKPEKIIYITEKLAHTDVYLDQDRLGKELVVMVSAALVVTEG